MSRRKHAPECGDRPGDVLCAGCKPVRLLRVEVRDYKKTTRYADGLVASLRAEVKRLRREKASQFAALSCFEEQIRFLFDKREAEQIIDKAKEAAIKPRRSRGKR